jgi:transposase
VPPEQLLSALLLQVFYSIRSERQLIACNGGSLFSSTAVFEGLKYSRYPF